MSVLSSLCALVRIAIVFSMVSYTVAAYLGFMFSWEYYLLLLCEIIFVSLEDYYAHCMLHVIVVLGLGIG